MKKIYTLLLGFGVALNVVAQMQVSQGTAIDVIASPKPGYRFIQWSDGNTENPRFIKVMDNVNLVAEFYYNDYTLITQVNSAERGSVTSGESIQYTQTKELIATPNYGYAFKNWILSGTGSSLSSTTSNPTIFTMGTADAVVTANFVPLQYRIILTSSNTMMGSVSGGGTYDYNTTRSIYASPKPGYRFIQWSDGNTENPRIITVMDNIDLVAKFDYNQSGGNGGDGTAVSENISIVLVCISDMQVIVKGATTQPISIYNVNGQLLESRVAVSDTEVFDMSSEGIYVVSVGEITYKIIVK